MHSVVFALIHFSIHSLYHSSLYSLDQSCACSVTHSFIPPPFVHSSIHSFIQLFFHSHVHFFTHSFIICHSFIPLGSPQEAWLLSSAPPVPLHSLQGSPPPWRVNGDGEGRTEGKLGTFVSWWKTLLCGKSLSMTLVEEERNCGVAWRRSPVSETQPPLVTQATFAGVNEHR